MTKIYGCPVEVTLDVLGGKWKTVILRHLSKRTLRYSQLHQRMPSITQRILTLQLKELEEDGLIQRIVFDERIKRVEYSLTEYGKGVEPILELMCEWGKQRMREFDLQVRAVGTSDEVIKGIEETNHFIVRIEWDSMEGHMQGFRTSTDFQHFFALVKPFFNAILEMKHYSVIANSQ
ncbi:hypothetical protein GC102_07855 [Paenibacillus sp. LMG 31460]|uniref:HTH hxlR-type domain-containing protein n=1 Tax=Paenibacillus germinis TaxID=2654979 RepID=A0ABX1YX38_9BACL|nr:hypothetical protein [Paenibacillus germinis]